MAKAGLSGGEWVIGKTVTISVPYHHSRYQNDRTGTIFDALLLPPLMFGLPEVRIAYDETWKGCGE